MLSSEKPNQFGKFKTCLKKSEEQRELQRQEFFSPLPEYFPSLKRKDNRILECEGKKTSVSTQKNRLSLGHLERQVHLGCPWPWSSQPRGGQLPCECSVTTSSDVRVSYYTSRTDEKVVNLPQSFGEQRQIQTALLSN